MKKGKQGRGPGRPQLANKKKSGSQMVRHSGFFHGKYQSNQLLGSMGKCDIVMFALCPLLSEISSKGRIPVADVLGCVVKGIA